LGIPQTGGSKAPNGFIIMLKDGNVLTRMEGGSSVLRLELLYLKNEERGVLISRNLQNYSYLPSVVPTPEPKAIKKEDVIQVLGFRCERYELELNHKRGYPSRQVIWATRDIRGINKNCS
jgi:hypothetical protein